ncbi:hypothetical protein, partial [Rhizorhabdus wittichii]|uniref:hypothetical protein n=1 Tax=Rhizorhabdus wittichii TaxID=160791 RepID=UPI0012FD16E5
MTIAKGWQSRSRSISNRAIALAVLIGTSITVSARAEQGSPNWQVMRGSAPGSATTPLCLNETSRMRRSQAGPWHLSIGVSETCSERFLADLNRRQIYFDFDPSFTWSPATTGSAVDADCERGQSYTGYTACTSLLFEQHGKRKRVLRSDVPAMFNSADARSRLQQAWTEGERAAIASIRTRYRSEFAEATTLEKIIAFEGAWRNFDPEQLVPKLQPLKQRLIRERYVAAFNGASTADDLTRFIDLHAGDDPDNLVPLARKKLALLQAADQARQRSLREKQAVADRVAAQVARRKEAAARVTNCKRMTSAAYASLERERSIAAVSGVENLSVKRQAGEIIVACQQIIGR